MINKINKLKYSDFVLFHKLSDCTLFIAAREKDEALSYIDPV